MRIQQPCRRCPHRDSDTDKTTSICLQCKFFDTDNTKDCSTGQPTISDSELDRIFGNCGRDDK